MEASECGVCTDRFTKTGKKKAVTCLFCNYMCCRDCVQAYIISHMKDPCCLNCSKKWDNDFIMSIFPKSVYEKDLKNHRKIMLYEREKSLIPNTIALAKRYKDRKKLDEDIAELENQLNDIKMRLASLYVKSRRRNAKEYINSLKINGNGEDDDDEGEVVEAKRFIQPCVSNNCKGFLSTQWKCELCEIWVCSKCREIKNGREDNDHVCNQESIKTYELLSKDTKPCPKCRTSIYKISGCSMMFCTNCNTAFDWKSLQVINRNRGIHNPHYFEWLKNGGKDRNKADVKEEKKEEGIDIELEDEKCCEIVDINDDFIHYIPDSEKELTRFYSGLLTAYIETSQNLRNIYPSTEFDIDVNTPNRILFILGNISEDVFKKRVHINDKKFLKLREEAQIVQTFVTITRETIREMAMELDKYCRDNKLLPVRTINGYGRYKSVLSKPKYSPRNFGDVTAILNKYKSRLIECRRYINECLEKTHKKYGMVVPFIEDDWVIGKISKYKGKKMGDSSEEKNDDTSGESDDESDIKGEKSGAKVKTKAGYKASNKDKAQRKTMKKDKNKDKV